MDSLLGFSSTQLVVRECGDEACGKFGCSAKIRYAAPHVRHPCLHHLSPTRQLLAIVLAQQMPYRLNEETGLIDYDTLEKNAVLFRPKLIVAGEQCERGCTGMCGSNKPPAASPAVVGPYHRGGG